MPGDGTHWRITAWDDGTTEPGSSGSPLFDKDHRIIGQLYGGPSSCTASPEYMNDYYGRFSVSWEGTSPDVRLKDWLDPLNIDPPFIDGYDPNTPTFALDAKPKSIDAPLTAYCGLQSISPVIKIQNAGATELTSLTVKYSLNGGVFTEQIWAGNLTTGAIALVTFPSISLNLGNHVFTVVTENPNGLPDDNTSNDTLVKNFSVSIGATLPFTENFESSVFPPVTWSILNPDGSITWDRTTLAAGNGTSTGSACISLRGYTGTGQMDALLLPKINMETISNATMTFKVAYRRYNAQYSDRLKIYISTDCGLSFNTVIYDKSGSTLATGPDMTTAFFPVVAEDWRTETINLTPYIGNTIQLKFECTNQNGNNLFIDDINIMNNMPPGALFYCNDTSSCTGVISFIDQSYGFPETWLWNFGDGDTMTSNDSVVYHTFSNSGNTPLNYYITLIAGSSTGCTDTIIRQITVYPQITSAFASEPLQGCSPLAVNFTNQSEGAANYLWNFGDGIISQAENPTHVFINESNEDILYSVSLLSYSLYNCIDSSKINVNVSPAPVALFTTDTTESCTPFTLAIQNLSSGGDSYIWNFGDGDSLVSDSANISHLYVNNSSQMQAYQLVLNAVTVEGCTAQFSKTVFL